MNDCEIRDENERLPDAPPGMAWFRVSVDHLCHGYTVAVAAPTEEEAQEAAAEADWNAECDHEAEALAKEIPGTRTPQRPDYDPLDPTTMPPPVCQGQMSLEGEQEAWDSGVFV